LFWRIDPVEDRKYWNEAVETMAPKDLLAVESGNLRKQVAYVHERSPFYRNKFEEAGVSPDAIRSREDIVRLPFTEQMFGFENAAKMDGMVWERVAPAQAHRTIKALGLGDDMQALASLLKFTAPQWVSAGFEWEFTEVTDTRLKMVIHACPMGTFRKAQNLELLPCKHLSPPLYIGLAKIINEKIEAKCLHAHPDPPKENVMCAWEFVLPT